MKVKVGSRVYDGDETPVMAIFSEEDKKNLRETYMPTKYCSYPDVVSEEDVREFMKIPEDNPRDAVIELPVKGSL